MAAHPFYRRAVVAALLVGQAAYAASCDVHTGTSGVTWVTGLYASGLTALVTYLSVLSWACNRAATVDDAVHMIV
jgi:hypothetical protein